MKPAYRKLDVEDVRKINEAMIAEGARATQLRRTALAHETVLSAFKSWLIRRLTKPATNPAPAKRPRRYIHFTRAELNAAYAKALRDMRDGN